MRDDFCIFILTHGRADRVHTLTTLKRCGYTGKVYLVIDDEDATAPDYYARYGEQVLMFSKEAISKTFDEGDNFNDRRTITYARNACWALAEQVGCRYFMQLDDDYYWFGYRFDRGYTINNINGVLSALCEFVASTSTMTIAFSQGGDHIGGVIGPIKLKRKAMNSFICAVDRQFQFRGRFNEDVNTYTSESRTGSLFFTLTSIQLDQKDTQSNEGGITELYKKFGTYVKSFTTVIHAPSCVKVAMMGETNKRLHHRINWNATAPKIIRESHRKTAHA